MCQKGQVEVLNHPVENLWLDLKIGVQGDAIHPF